MSHLKWLAAVVLARGVSACGSSNSPYRGDYAYSPGAYDYNQQPTYYRTHYANGQPTCVGRQPTTTATDISPSRSTTAPGPRTTTAANM